MASIYSRKNAAGGLHGSFSAACSSLRSNGVPTGHIHSCPYGHLTCGGTCTFLPAPVRGAHLL